MDSHLQPPPESPPKRRFGLVIFLLSLIITSTAALIYFLFTRPLPLLSPLGNLSNVLGIHTPVQKTKIVYGYLPYWNFKYADEIPFQYLTHLALFGVTFTDTGNIQTRELDYTEPGWRNIDINSPPIIEKAKQFGVKPILTLISFDNDTINSITSSALYTQNFISETIEVIDSKGFTGVNIDFEYVGEPTSQSRQNFAQFVSTVSRELKLHNPDLEVSIAVYADSAEQNRIWDLATIGPSIDHIIIMAYDFYRPSSPQAGPVAPLYGATELLWQTDITTTISKHLKINSPDKLILGVPYYGYEWTTTSTDYLSNTVKGTGQLASYKRVQELLKNPQLDILPQWSRSALSPWFAYQHEDGSIRQIHYDNPSSLGLKYDLVNQTGMAGVAIWALGYDGGAQELWQPIQSKFTAN